MATNEEKSQYLEGYKSALKHLANESMNNNLDVPPMAETELHSAFWLGPTYVNVYVKFDDTDMFIASVNEKGLSLFNEDVYYMIENPIDGICDLVCLFN